MNIYTPYTYRIGWSLQDKWYYGVQTRKGCHPDNLWKKYFTSSKIVKIFRKIYGEPDIIQIRKTFSDKESALLWEIKVLQKLGVVNNHRYLNQRVVYMGGSTSSRNWMYTEGGKELLKESKRKWKVSNPDWKPWNSGLTKNDSQLLIDSSNRAIYYRSIGKLHCIGDSMRGTSFTTEHINKLKRRAKDRKKIKCEHCLKDMPPGMFKRWHGDNCKLNLSP